MGSPTCRKCLLIRTVLMTLLMGGGAGWLALWLGAGQQVSMLATFFGAMLPIMSYARQTRPRR